MDKIKIAIIGATGTAYKRIIPALENSKLCKITSIQGRNINQIVEIKNKFHIEETYTNIDEMISHNNFDCIYIATPPFLHLDNIFFAAKTNKPIVCEKPLACSYKEGLDIYKILKSYPDKNFRIAHQLRHQKAILDILELIKQGFIGEVLNVFIQWGFEMNLGAKNAIWKTNPKLQGLGSFNDNGIHLIDIIIFLFGIPISVFGKSDNVRLPNVYDNEAAVLIYEKLSVFVNSSQSMKFSGNHLLIYGTKGSIEAFYSIGEMAIEQVSIRTKDGTNNIKYSTENLYKNEFEDYSKYLLNRSPWDRGTSLRDGIAALKIIDKIHESVSTKKIININ